MHTEISELTQVYLRHKSQLRSFILRLSGNETETEDIMQESYEKAFRNLSSFRGKSSLKTWLFSISANVAKNNRKVRQRWVENVTDLGREAAMHDPEILNEMMKAPAMAPAGEYEINQQIAFCFSCVSKSLPLDQQVCLLLKEACGFKISEIGVIVENNQAMVKYLLHQGRKTMMDIFDQRCSLIKKEGMCEQCTELNGIYNPKQVLQESRVKTALEKEARRGAAREDLFAIRSVLLKEIDPYESPGSAIQRLQLMLNDDLMDRNEKKTT